jgi:1-deoxy-D-xylulose-5-phosphate synthase
VVVTPAMLEGSALVELKTRYPERVYDVGIAEQHAVTFCAGLAAAGALPVCAIYSTFLQRAFDQVIHDVCLPGLPVVFAVDRAGLVGADGATHQGAYDISSLRALPGLAMMAPVVGEDLPPMLATALTAPGPTVLRFPRGTLPAVPPELEPGEMPIRGARWLLRAESPRLTLVTLGPLGLAALAAAKAESGWSVLDARCVSPLDVPALLEAAASGSVVVAEEGTTRGGLGSAVLELYAAHGRTPRVKLMGMPDAFVPHGDARVQRAELGLDVEGLRRAGAALLGAGR